MTWWLQRTAKLGAGCDVHAEGRGFTRSRYRARLGGPQVAPLDLMNLPGNVII